MSERLAGVLYSREQIAERVTTLGAELTGLYAGKPLVVICVLKGAVIFFADIVRELSAVHPELDFVRIASYGQNDRPESAISFTKDVELDLAGKHVLIVEDVVDTGHSMAFLRRQLEARGAASLRLCVLIDKGERREVPVQVDFAGFKLAEGFIVGYGLDYAERYRELPDIHLLELL